MPAWGLPGGGPHLKRLTTSLPGCGENVFPMRGGALPLRPNSKKWSHPEKSRQVLFELHCARCHPHDGLRGACFSNNGGVRVAGGGQGMGSSKQCEPQAALSRYRRSNGIYYVGCYGQRHTEELLPRNYGMPGFGRVLSQEEIRAISE